MSFNITRMMWSSLLIQQTGWEEQVPDNTGILWLIDTLLSVTTRTKAISMLWPLLYADSSESINIIEYIFV